MPFKTAGETARTARYTAGQQVRESAGTRVCVISACAEQGGVAEANQLILFVFNALATRRVDLSNDGKQARNQTLELKGAGQFKFSLGINVQLHALWYHVVNIR